MRTLYCCWLFLLDPPFSPCSSWSFLLSPYSPIFPLIPFPWTFKGHPHFFFDRYFFPFLVLSFPFPCLAFCPFLFPLLFSLYVFVWCLFRSLIGPKSGQNPKKKKHPNLQPHEERKKNCYLKKKKEFISFLASKLQNPLLC